MRSASLRPASAEAMTAGAAIPVRDSVVALTRPAETEKGSLTRLTRKKNQAVVPRKALTG